MHISSELVAGIRKKEDATQSKVSAIRFLRFHLPLIGLKQAKKIVDAIIIKGNNNPNLEE